MSLSLLLGRSVRLHRCHPLLTCDSAAHNGFVKATEVHDVVAAATGVVQTQPTRRTDLDRCLVGHGPGPDLVQVRHVGHAFAIGPDRGKPGTFAVGIGEIERERGGVSRKVAQRGGEVDNDLAIRGDLADRAAYDSMPVTGIEDTDGELGTNTDRVSVRVPAAPATVAPVNVVKEQG